MSPSRANSIAASRPMFRLAPVINTVLPLSPVSIPTPVVPERAIYREGREGTQRKTMRNMKIQNLPWLSLSFSCFSFAFLRVPSRFNVLSYGDSVIVEPAVVVKS